MLLAGAGKAVPTAASQKEVVDGLKSKHTSAAGPGGNSCLRHC